MINLTSTYILRRLADEDIHAFRVSEFRRLFGVDVRRAYQILLRLESRGLLERFAKGRYVVVGVGHSEPASNAFFLATRVVEPSYVSFWSALNYYAWTEQVPRVVMVANTRRTGLRRVGPFRAQFVRLRPARFFGYQLERMGNLDIPFAEPEKAILDSLFLPECAGGIDEVAKSISEAVPELDLTCLFDYAGAMADRSLCSRLGHLLARDGIDASRLLPSSSRVYVPLDPARPRRGRYDARWRVVDNLPEAS